MNYDEELKRSRRTMRFIRRAVVAFFLLVLLLALYNFHRMATI